MQSTYTINDDGFNQLYLEQYAGLYRYAYAILQDSALCEDIIHQVFFKLLEKRESITIHTSVKAYLYRAVNHECLNYIKHQKVKMTYQDHTTSFEQQSSDNAGNKLYYQELELKLKDALNELPEQCRTIFQLSRFEELKYAQIAAQLGLSVKTVETQMSRALKKLRVQLADYLPLMLLMYLLINKY